MRSHPRIEWLTLIALCGAAAGLALAPESLQDGITLNVRDAAAPIQAAARWSVDRIENACRRRIHVENSEAIAEQRRLRDELAAAIRRTRALEIQLAEMRDTFDRRNDQLREGDSSASLIVRDVLSASVLGEENSALCRGGKLLRAGAADGISESSLVLEDRRPLIDQGSLSEVEEGQAVLAGRCIVGRIARAGRWVSTVLPVTDPQFRAAAQIVRRSEQGPAFAAKGLLEGHNDGLCRLRHVPATEAVAEGDDVYTGDRDANSPEPLYYGTIVKAEIPPGSPHWEIHVRPAASVEAMKSVQVVRKKANPVRMLAN